MRIKLVLEYDGTAYAGWQLQKNAPTVQLRLEQALEKCTGAFTRVTGASRTDAGVHAAGQVAHFDTESAIPPEKFSYALNTLLPPDIRVRASMRAPDGFHARFWASGKRYQYLIYNDLHASALLRCRTWHVYQQLDIQAMRAAARLLEGTHDFAPFCAAGSVAKTTTRTLQKVRVYAPQPHIVAIDVAGTAFLYNMVRIIAGTLAGIGAGKLAPDVIARMFATGDRRIGGVTAPACGLTLAQVFYHSEKPPWVRL
nr:tRNA pseudouridine(38-40) synthase TruA [Maliibacterium massiliense]